MMLSFVTWVAFANYSQIPEIYIFSYFFLIIPYSQLLYDFHLKKLPDKQSHSQIYAYFLYIFNRKIRYSWILWKICVNSNNIHQITIFANRNNIHELKLWWIGIGIYLWPKYQKIDLWRINLWTICELFTTESHYILYLYLSVWC